MIPTEESPNEVASATEEKPKRTRRVRTAASTDDASATKRPRPRKGSLDAPAASHLQLEAREAAAGVTSAPAPVADGTSEAATSEAAQTPAEPPKRKRGRPRKVREDEPRVEETAKSTEPSAALANASSAAAVESHAAANTATPDISAAAESHARAAKSDASASEARTAHATSGDETTESRASHDASHTGRAHTRVQVNKKQQPRAKHQVNSNNSNNQNGQKNQNQNQNRRFNKRNAHQNQHQNEVTPPPTLEELTKLKVAELRERAEELSIETKGLKKAELAAAIIEAIEKRDRMVDVAGVLDVLSDGYGFLRTEGYLPSENDVYVSTSMLRRNGLRKGDFVKGQIKPQNGNGNEKYAALQRITSVNDVEISELTRRPRFADLTPVYPDNRLLMEHGKNTITARVIDLVAPIGKGQRGLIVSPPKAGKTTVLKDIAASISANNPEVHLMCLLVDERPEEVTDMQRSIKGEVISSTFDMPSENHIAVAEMVIERAKRLVELGHDVVILLDSITRLARAYNLAQPASGRILSGGVDSTALYPPKRFLGAARNIEHGGSLTILASALIDTGSKMDEVIFEEFKGTGNMELKLDRSLADRRIFPAIDPVQSGTRKEDLLLDPQEAPLIWAVRRILANTNNTERSMDMLIKSLKQTRDNQEFLLRTAKKAQGSAHRGEDTMEL